MPTHTRPCHLCGVLLELSPITRRFYAVGEGSPHWCAIVELAPSVAIECCCGAHVERDRDGVKWEHGEPHVCSVRAAAPIGRGEHSPTPERGSQSVRPRTAGDPERVQKASAPGSSGADSPRLPERAAAARFTRRRTIGVGDLA